MEALANIAVAALVFPVLAQEPAASGRLRALDQGLAREVLRGTTPLRQPELRAYVRSVGQRLAKEMPGAPADYVFDVLQNLDAAEPVALPAGPVYIPDQFLIAARNEAEFADVLAHCMAHVALRHGIRPTPQTSNLASIPLVIIGGTHCVLSEASRSHRTDRAGP